MEDVVTYSAKDFASDQEVRWCPGCGDYSILKQTQQVLANTNIPKEKTVFISGIGCSSRFPYYMNTYGMHSIHGRAPAIASGLKIANPDLNVWIITGDGDGLSIGGNHLIHIFRRNINVNILLFNNEIYGLTKGQYSPTSNKGLKTKSSPMGVIDTPFNPIALALGAGASFIARSVDRNPKHLRDILAQGQEHRGTSFVEIYQNCIIFNDEVFSDYTGKDVKDNNTLYLENGKPLLFGKDNEFALILDNLTPKVVNTSEINEDKLWIHDTSNKTLALLLSEIFELAENTNLPRPFGVFYKEERDVYEDKLHNQLTKNNNTNKSINAILKGKNNWEI